ncbi:MAG: MFS transporter [Clostridia bacterium]|nr:MFS transporter [Clostridia bacterium]
MQKKLWNKNYIMLLQANAVSTIGDLMYSVAIGYWVYEKTGSSGLMGVMSAVSMFVTMFLSPFSGSVVDKLNRKWVLVLTDIIQGLIMLGVGVLAYMDALNVPVVLLAALLAAFGGVFYSPAARTLMIDIIPHDDMVRGQSVFSGTLTAIDMVGTAFSGVMVAFFGVPLIIVINGLSNLYSAFAELFIHAPKTVQEGNGVTVKGILHDSKDAVKAIFSDRCLKVLIPGVLVLNLLCAGPLRLVLPFCMEKGFTVDMYGYLLTVHTAASLLAVTVLGIVKLKPKVRFWVMALGFSLAVVFLILSYLSTDFIVMCVLAFLASLLNTAGNAILNASLTLALPASNRGAILGFLQSASVGGVALSALLYGVLGDVFPLYIVFAAGSAVSLAPMLYMCFHRDVKSFILDH